MSTRQSRQQGFTAVEMMIVLVIIGILTAFAAPNMVSMVRTQRVKTTAFDLNASLVFARSEAVKRNVAVTVKATAAGSPADWTQGWRVVDANNNVLKEEGNRNYNASELVFTGPDTVVFARNGRLTAAPAVPFVVKGPYLPSEKQRCITLDMSGRPNTKESATCP